MGNTLTSGRTDSLYGISTAVNLMAFKPDTPRKNSFILYRILASDLLRDSLKDLRFAQREDTPSTIWGKFSLFFTFKEKPYLF